MDLAIFNLINQVAGKWLALDFVGIFFAKYSGYFLIIVVFFILWRRWKIIFQVFLAAIISRFVVTEVIRFFWHRQRPLNLLSEASFPSGHAAFYFAIAAVIYFYNKKIGIIFFAVSALMGVARVFVGVHWPSDILAGALIGILFAWLVVRKLDSLHKKELL